MREWLYALLPVGLVVYFSLFPAQFAVLMSFVR